ncbi:hypothetical protein QWY77_07560 [Thalassotalea ponticola]|nr:hypothetical protein [Thalassotalea ponticola]MDN3652617.1 hypothetical protein [Thalassotalea ponticola]
MSIGRVMAIVNLPDQLIRIAGPTRLSVLVLLGTLFAHSDKKG